MLGVVPTVLLPPRRRVNERRKGDEEVEARLPQGEWEPRPEGSERVVFLPHFKRGFGLPASAMSSGVTVEPIHDPDSSAIHPRREKREEKRKMVTISLEWESSQDLYPKS